MTFSDEQVESFRDFSTIIKYILLTNEGLPTDELSKLINNSIQPSVSLLMQLIELKTKSSIYEELSQKL